MENKNQKASPQKQKWMVTDDMLRDLERQIMRYMIQNLAVNTPPAAK